MGSCASATAREGELSEAAGLMESRMPMRTFFRMHFKRHRVICLLTGLLLAAITTMVWAADDTVVGKLCGFSPQEWSVNLALSAQQRRGDPLPFTYWNLLLAVSMIDLADRTNDASLRSYAESIIGRFVAADGSISGFPPVGFELLQTMPTGQIFIRMHERTGDERYRKGAFLVREAMKALPRTTGGVFAWRPDQVWLDGLWFSLPFYARYGHRFGETEIFDDIRRQYAAVYEHSRDLRTGLLHHGWDAKHEQFWANPKTGTSAAFWSRAIGWYAMSLVDVLDDFPEKHTARPYLIRLLADIAQSVVRYQDHRSGLWYQVIDQPNATGNYLESSASAMFVYVIAKGVNRGYLNRRFSSSALSGYAGLIRDKIEVDPQGGWSLIDIVQSAGLGAPPVWPPGSPPSSRRDALPRGRDGSVQYYLEQPMVKDHSWGLGAFIRAGLEVQDLMKKTALSGKEVPFAQLPCRSSQRARSPSSQD
jgi:unsaturated rhamnogalacturonyl hydrolase